MNKLSKTDKFKAELIELFLPETVGQTAGEVRWRSFLRNLKNGLVHDKNNNDQANPGEWKSPSNLVGLERTMFELLQYPTLKSSSEQEAKLRELGRQIYQSINDPETFNKAPETKESLTARLDSYLLNFHRHLLGHQDIRSNSETGRWEHRSNRYHGTFSQEIITVISPKGSTILQITYQPGSNVPNTTDYRINSDKMVEFALILGIL